MKQPVITRDWLENYLKIPRGNPNMLYQNTNNTGSIPFANEITDIYKTSQQEGAATVPNFPKNFLDMLPQNIRSKNTNDILAELTKSFQGLQTLPQKANQIYSDLRQAYQTSGNLPQAVPPPATGNARWLQIARKAPRPSNSINPVHLEKLNQLKQKYFK